MANSGSNVTTTTTQTSKPGSQPILVVILVVVLSILVLCVSGIALVIYYRRRMRGKAYTRLQPSSESSDNTAVNNTQTLAPNSPSRFAWSSFLRRIDLRRLSGPDQYGPVNLSDGRPPAKLFSPFGNPNIPGSPPATESSLAAAPKRLVPTQPIPRQNSTPIVTFRSPPPPQNSNPAFSVSQSVLRIAPLPPSDPTPRPRPVRVPSAPIILPTRENSPTRTPIEILNINRPSNFTIDGSSSPSTIGPTIDNKRGRRPEPHTRSHSDGHGVTNRRERAEPVTQSTERSPSTYSGVRSQDSDSVVDRRANEPVSPLSTVQSPRSDGSASTTASIAGSSKPPTMTFKNLLKSISPVEAVLPPLHFPKSISLSLPSSSTRTSGRAPNTSQDRHVLHSQSPPHHQTQFGEPRQDHRHYMYTSQHPLHRIRPQPSQTRPQDHRGETRLTNGQEQRGLYRHAVTSAESQTGRTGRVASPLPPVTAESSRLGLPAAPPPTPNSWAPLRTNRL